MEIRLRPEIEASGSGSVWGCLERARLQPRRIMRNQSRL